SFYFPPGNTDKIVFEYRADYSRGSHWWIRGPRAGLRGAGKIHDLTEKQFSAPFPHERGKNCGFMQPQRKPSKRAQIVIDRVTEKLGREALAAFRKNCIRAFQEAQKKPMLQKKKTLCP